LKYKNYNKIKKNKIMGYNMKRGGKPKFKDLGSDTPLNNESPLKHTGNGWHPYHHNIRDWSVKDWVIEGVSLLPPVRIARGVKTLNTVKNVVKASNTASKTTKKTKNVVNVSKTTKSKKTTNVKTKNTTKKTTTKKDGKGGKEGKKLTTKQKVKRGIVITTAAAIVADQLMRKTKENVSTRTAKTEWKTKKLDHYNKWIKTQKENYGDINEAQRKRNEGYDALNTKLDKSYVPGSSLLDADGDGIQDTHKLTVSKKKMSEMMRTKGGDHYNEDFDVYQGVINQSKLDHSIRFPDEQFQNIETDTLPSNELPTPVNYKKQKKSK
jgi:hypothetical protein